MSRLKLSAPPRLFFLLFLCWLGTLPASASAAATAVQQTESQEFIDHIRFLGNRRVPAATLRARIFSKPGDPYDPDALRRDFMSLWNAGFFENIRLEVEDGDKGKIVLFHVQEKPTIRAMDYKGIKSVTVSEILERFQERRVSLTPQSQYEPTRVRRAEVVLTELLAERGRQYAKVRAEPKRVPPNSVMLDFVVDEGPKVKVGEIEFTGNAVLSSRALRRAMKHLRPIGIPRSIILENIFSKTFDHNKLAADLEQVRGKYQDRGYFTALVLDPDINNRDTGGGWFRIPLFYPNRPSKRVDLTIPIQEGDQYRVGKLAFTGVKFFRQPDVIMYPLFKMKEGDIFNVSKIREGLESLRKLYGEFGFINMVPTPDADVDRQNKIISMTFDIEEDKQFFVRRIEFAGNTTTRDKVIRRELLLDEGAMFNSRLWEISILRLNQLGFFEALKPEEADIRPNNRTGQVDINLNVKERGKNTIGLTGGTSGIAGSFVGMNYSTNNFMGLGETLTFAVELGNRQRNILFGFTEPYLFDRPLQMGFTIFARRFSFNQAREASILSGRDLIPLFELLGTDNIQNFRQSSQGFTVFASYPLRRSFARLGLTFGFDRSDIRTFSSASKQFFEFLNFRGASGPNALEGITTSRVIPSYLYNTVDHPITPSRGTRILGALEFAGLGGNVRLVRPSFEFTKFIPANKKGHIVGFRFLTSVLSGYGGRVAPPFQRMYIGGETDIRGFFIRAVSPMAYVTDEATIGVVNQDGTPRFVPVVVDGQVQQVPQTVTFPVNRIIFPGGDLQTIGNFEYRVPLFGPVTLAGFFDAGLNTVWRQNQLTMNPSRLSELVAKFPGREFPSRVQLLPGTNRQIRSSTGLELQVLLPVVNAPFRVYWAYNPNRLETLLAPPVLINRSQFPNQATFNAALLTTPRVFWREKSRTFRFTVGRTF